MNMFQIGFGCNKVAEHWGDRMPMMAMEEAGEFIQAISKYERALKDEKSEEAVKHYEQNLIDEIGDMWISLMALQSLYEDGTWADRIDERIEKKLNKKY